MSKEKEDKGQQLADLDSRIQSMYDRWNLWKEQGAQGSDVSDGEYLNRLRTGIMYLQKKMEEYSQNDEYPETYYAMLPPEIEEDYMAGAELIKQQAANLWNAYQNNPDYQWLCSYYSAARPRKKDRDYEAAERLLKRAGQLKDAVLGEDILVMKREIRKKNLSRDFKRSRRKLESRKLAGRRPKKRGKDADGQMCLEQLKAS